MNWVLFWLLLHIAAAIIAFGPTFVFPLMEPTLKARPAGLGFAMLLSEKMERGLIIPVALTMVVSGIGLIIAENLNFFGNRWLVAGIVLYLIALSIAVLNQVPATARLVELTRDTPSPPGPPSAEILALLRRTKTGGIALTILLLTIIFLMVIKPGGVA